MPKVSVAHEEKRREQILGAAMACFARQGYRSTSIEDIVRESGLSVGALYTYFPSKEDIFLAIADRRTQDTLARLRELFRQPGPMSEKTQQAVDYFFGQLEEELIPLARVGFEFWGEARTSDRLQATHLRRCDTIRQFYRWLMAEGQRTGELRADLDVDATAEVFMALNEGILMIHAAGMTSVSRDALKRAYIEMVNHGLATHARPLLHHTTEKTARRTDGDAATQLTRTLTAPGSAALAGR